MPTTFTGSGRPKMLVVGATGYLRSQVVDEPLARGKNLGALVRLCTDATTLEAQSVPDTSRTPRGKPKSSGSRRPAMTPSNAWLNNYMPTADCASARLTGKPAWGATR
jgi:hypothetical protein